MGPSDCRPGDTTVTCCIKKHPQDPVGACGATVSEMEAAIQAGAVVDALVSMSRAEEDEFANNRDLPEWKQRCIRAYVDCQRQGWTGRCEDCLRYGEGQREWPLRRCGPRG